MMTNKEVVFNKMNYKSYRDFYVDIYKKLDGKNTIDFKELNDLHYQADILNEFMWYKQDENLNLVFKKFDKDEIKKQKSYDDYEWNLIIEIMEDFVKDYPNNTLEFRDE